MRKSSSVFLIAALALVGCDKDDPADVPFVPTTGGTSTANPSVPAGTSSTAPGASSSVDSTGTSSSNGEQGPSSPTTGEASTTTTTTTTTSSSTTGATSSVETSSSSTPSSSSSDEGTSSDETSTGADPKPEFHRWTKGHGDITISWDKDANSIRADIVIQGPAIVDGKRIPNKTVVKYDPAKLLIVGGTKMMKQTETDMTKVAPLCVEPGETLFLLPASVSHTAEIPFFGIARYISRKSPVVDQKVTMMFDSIEGPDAENHFAIWSFLGGKYTYTASSCDGLDEQDYFKRGWGHNHYNITFPGSAGRRVIHMRAKSTLEDGSTQEISFPLHFEFSDPNG